MRDFDDAFARDCEKEPSLLRTRRKPQLVATGTLRQHFVCTSAQHEAMKADGRFGSLPLAGRGYMLVEREGDEPAEVLECRNCECHSTLAKVIDTDESPTWLHTLRTAGLI